MKRGRLKSSDVVEQTLADAAWLPQLPASGGTAASSQIKSHYVFGTCYKIAFEIFKTFL